MSLCNECTGSHPIVKIQHPPIENLRPNPHKVEQQTAAVATATIVETEPKAELKKHKHRSFFLTLFAIELCIALIIGTVIGVPVLAQHINWCWDTWVKIFWFCACCATALALLALVFTLIGAVIEKFREFTSDHV